MGRALSGGMESKEYRWVPQAGNSGSYAASGYLEGRASITKLVGPRGGTKGFTLVLDDVVHTLGRRASFADADIIIARSVSTWRA